MASNANRTRNQHLILSGITMHFANSEDQKLDIYKVRIVDAVTGKPLFAPLVEGEAKASEVTS